MNNAYNGPPGMNRAPQSMGMGPMGPNNMGVSPQPPSNWREMMNKNAAQQRMYPNQMGPQMHQGQGQRMGGGGGGPHKRFRDNKGATINKPQQVTFQAKFLKVGCCVGRSCHLIKLELANPFSLGSLDSQQIRRGDVSCSYHWSLQNIQGVAHDRKT